MATTQKKYQGHTFAYYNNKFFDAKDKYYRYKSNVSMYYDQAWNTHVSNEKMGSLLSKAAAAEKLRDTWKKRADSYLGILEKHFKPELEWVKKGYYNGKKFR